VTVSEPGAVWTLRALRAVPQLTHVRTESHRLVTDRLTEAYQRFYPEVCRELLWRRLRIAVEFGFAADEMLTEETGVPREEILKEAAKMLRNAVGER